MSLATKPMGVAGMPPARSSRAPHFAGTNSESLSDFLREYENLADSLGLSEEEKVDTILCYVPRALQSLWSELRGYLVKDWDELRDTLEALYPDITIRHTRQNLETFQELSAKCRLHNEGDLLNYHRNFLTIASPLFSNHEITLKDFLSSFLNGFHRSHQRRIRQRLEMVYLHQPPHDPYPIEGVLEAARHYLNSDSHQQREWKRAKNKDRGHSRHHHATPNDFVQQVFNGRRLPRLGV